LVNLVSFAAVVWIAEPRFTYRHHDGEFSRVFSSDFDITTSEVELSIRGISVTFHDTEPYVTFAHVGKPDDAATERPSARSWWRRWIRLNDADQASGGFSKHADEVGHRLSS
jgi:hypothetical protein